ncbi:hypothetical protein WCE02_08535 [Pseudomonas juntendi]|uniref:Uncharacterized protein n=1 Tax=Pseudomonas putida TaxID=303 RepID=A0A1X0ZPK1_PSEPU|nr:hypothetical protein [Pseudomonas putida]MEB3899052.1 hypothetical protein [Pseudomonas putida]ORL60119.1 hypothetical protein B7H17_22940 [Pseudomonas putida]
MSTLEQIVAFKAGSLPGILDFGWFEVHLAHAGRITQVWDAGMRSEDTSRSIALFRCTQRPLYPSNGDQA